jgi:indole-3-glycerol phosphate synthase
MRRLFDLSRELGMDVLFEAHTREEIDMIPSGATLYGINSRKFMASNRWHMAKLFARFGGSKSGSGKDFSVELDTFELVRYLPNEALKIAESGLKPSKLQEVIKLGYDAVLVGTSLLKSPEGVANMLAQFEQVLTAANSQTPA